MIPLRGSSPFRTSSRCPLPRRFRHLCAAASPKREGKGSLLPSLFRRVLHPSRGGSGAGGYGQHLKGNGVVHVSRAPNPQHRDLHGAGGNRWGVSRGAEKVGKAEGGSIGPQGGENPEALHRRGR